jgi:hypothetical protein
MSQEDYRLVKLKSLETFVKDCVEECPGAVIDKEELYGALVHYCREKGIFLITKDSVSKNLLMFLPDARSTFAKVDGVIKKCWQNIKLRKE